MTKRIVSGIFILTALGALGVILAGALTSGEQLIVRFLTAVIVAALGLYVISDLRLQADDDAMTARTGGPTRLATVEAPPNSTAAFMATVTKKIDPKLVDEAREGDPDQRELLQTTVLADASPAPGRSETPPPPVPPRGRPTKRSDHGNEPMVAPGPFSNGSSGRKSVSSSPKAPETVYAFGEVDDSENDADVESSVSAESDAVATDVNGEDKQQTTDAVSGTTDKDDKVAEEASKLEVTAAADDAKEDQDDAEVEITVSKAPNTSNVRDLFGLPAPNLNGKATERVTADDTAAQDDNDLTPAAETESGELVGSLAGISGGVIDATGSFRPNKGLNGSGERNGSHTGPFDIASTTAKISFSSDPLGDNVSFGNSLLNGSSSNGNGDHDAPIEATLADGEQNDSEESDYSYSDELQSPEHVWPAPPTALNGHVAETMESGSAHLRFDNHETPAVDEDVHELNGHSQTLPIPAAETELQAAEYADAPLAPIIDLRDLGTQATDTVDLAINAGEVEVIATLIEQGMLSTEGAISDRDVRTMVYVAFTSNELRKLLLAGGSPDGPNHGLDLGPVELFDERIHAPAPKTLYSGIDRPEAQSQLG